MLLWVTVQRVTGVLGTEGVSGGDVTRRLGDVTRPTRRSHCIVYAIFRYRLPQLRLSSDPEIKFSSYPFLCVEFFTPAVFLSIESFTTILTKFIEWTSKFECRMLMTKRHDDTDKTLTVRGSCHFDSHQSSIFDNPWIFWVVSLSKSFDYWN